MAEERIEKLTAENDLDGVNVTVKKRPDAGLPEHRDMSAQEMEYFRGLLEGILFLSTEPVSLGELAAKAGLDRMNTRILTDSLVDEYNERDGGVVLKEIAGGYQFLTSDRYSEDVKDIFKEQKKDSLSRSTLETLSIICYKQPITLPEIEEIRGSNSRSHITTLISLGLIKPQGQKPAPGRPTLYVTTKKFLTFFSLNSLTDLPTLEEVKELKFEDLD